MAWLAFIAVVVILGGAIYQTQAAGPPRTSNAEEERS